LKSIKDYLFISLLSSLTFVMSASGVYAYYSSAHEIDELFDAQLAQYTRLILDSHKESDAARVADVIRNKLGHHYENKISFQVFDTTKNLVSSSENSIGKPIGPFVEGYHEVLQHNGSTWKVFVLHDLSTKYWYMTAESLDIRKELVENVTRAVFVPIFAGMLFALIIIRIILIRGLAPLKYIGDTITRRNTGDFSPLTIGSIPSEVSVLVDDINSLLAMVNKSIDRERRFSADAAHEIKTPLASLKLHLANMESLSDGLLCRDTLAKACRSCNEIQRLIEQLLAINRLEPQYFSSTQHAVGLNPLCRKVLSEEAEFAFAKQQEIRFEGADEVLCINSNEALVEMLLRNLVHNAIQYTQSGGLISLRTYASNDSVFIEVTDNGPGIPAAQRNRVFDRFYRLDGDKHSSGVAGSGLGLAIVREIIDLHHGEIALTEGDNGNGLCVKVRLPRNDERLSQL
jgi:two-component system sensor histidine kinase QseC